MTQKAEFFARVPTVNTRSSRCLLYHCVQGPFSNLLASTLPGAVAYYMTARAGLPSAAILILLSAMPAMTPA